MIYLSPQPHSHAQTNDPSLQEVPPRNSPPVIILKLDDLTEMEGTIPPAFWKMAELLEARHIKGSFGVITAFGYPGVKSLQNSGLEYIEWVKRLYSLGVVEFWFHGWDHAVHNENGEDYCEFSHRSYEDQKQRFDRSQKIALEKFGFTYQTFGQGGGASKYPSFDESTLKVFAQDPLIKIWLYPKLIDESGRKLEQGGKIILDQVADVNLERSVGIADFNWFLQGYSKHPDRDYFVLQGHPNLWNNAQFDEVIKIIDYLIQQKAVFMTPSEYAAIGKKVG